MEKCHVMLRKEIKRNKRLLEAKNLDICWVDGSCKVHV